MSGERGLGNLDWLPDRSAAEASMYRGSEQPADKPTSGPHEATAEEEKEPSGQAKRRRQKTASASASRSTRSSASMKASKSGSGKGGKRNVTTTAEEAPPPPPARQREARVQFNHRILMDRQELLDQYKAAHGTTMQAIVDQMVDEYLDRRGLLPGDEDE